MIFYAIRKKGAEEIYFSWPEGSRRKLTAIEDFKPYWVPRLFRKRHHATTTLNNWLAGHLIVPDEGPTRLIPKPRRKRADWDIVSVELKPVEL